MKILCGGISVSTLLQMKAGSSAMIVVNAQRLVIRVDNVMWTNGSRITLD
jgi:hypothetical protein